MKINSTIMESKISVLAIVCFIVVLSVLHGIHGHPFNSDHDDDPVQRRWIEFKTKYNKSYSNAEEEHKAFENFFANLRKIVKHNAESRLYKMDVNQMSDWSQGKYQSLNGFVASESRASVSKTTIDKSKHHYQAPEAVDWRNDPRRVGPVKNQGDCGACWAFGTVGLLEGQQKRNSTGHIVPLSEQNLIDCDKLDHGCTSGNFVNALRYIKEAHGLETEKDYPYKSGVFECSYQPHKAFVTTMYLNRSVELEPGNELLLQETVAKYGPVAAAIDANTDGFRHYKKGLFYDSDCTKRVNHGVLIVGYGTTDAGQDYWIIKNSWSKQWGEQGYALIARNKDNHCGIANNAVISIVDSQS